MSLARVYRQAIRLIKNGEPVDAATSNRPVIDLAGNVAAIRAIVDELQIGRAILLRDQAVDAGLADGQPVYLDAATAKWKPAKATLDVDGNDAGTWNFGPASHVGGVLESRVGGRGTVVLVGELVLPASWLARAFDGAYAAGPVYLSRVNAGKLSTSGLLSIRVGTVSGPDQDGMYTFIVMPSTRESLATHSHLKVSLVAEPAGTPNDALQIGGETLVGELFEGGPLPDFVHTLDSANTTLPGWLDAGNAAFSGLRVPAGAKFGYNIAAHAELNAVWPPNPIHFAKSAVVTIDGNVADADQVVINESGIWWMRNSYGNAPWSVNFRRYNDSSSSSDVDIELRKPVITLWFNAMASQTEATFLTSVTSSDRSVSVQERGGVVDLTAATDFVHAALRPTMLYPTEEFLNGTYACEMLRYPPSVQGVPEDMALPNRAALPCVALRGGNASAYYSLIVDRAAASGQIMVTVKLRISASSGGYLPGSATGSPEPGDEDIESTVAVNDLLDVAIQVTPPTRVGELLPTPGVAEADVAAVVRPLTWAAGNLQAPIGSDKYVDIETEPYPLTVEKDTGLTLVLTALTGSELYIFNVAVRTASA